MKSVCPECPWRKKDRVNGHVPAMPERVLDIARGNKTIMACHMSQYVFLADKDQKGIRRCRGIATFRANVGLDSEVFPDPYTVFTNDKEALDRWPKQTYINWDHHRKRYFREYPKGHYLDEKDQWWIAGKLAPNHNDVCLDNCEDSVTR